MADVMAANDNGPSQDAPLRLSVAAELAFPQGGMTASGLRREADKGRLVIERIAGKDYTTLAAIAEMRKLCRVERKAHASGYSRRDEIKPVQYLNRPSGVSEMDLPSGVQVSPTSKLEALRKQLSKPLQNTSISEKRRA